MINSFNYKQSDNGNILSPLNPNSLHDKFDFSFMENSSDYLNLLNSSNTKEEVLNLQNFEEKDFELSNKAKDLSINQKERFILEEGYKKGDKEEEVSRRAGKSTDLNQEINLITGVKKRKIPAKERAKNSRRRKKQYVENLERSLKYYQDKCETMSKELNDYKNRELFSGNFYNCKYNSHFSNLESYNKNYQAHLNDPLNSSEELKVL